MSSNSMINVAATLLALATGTGATGTYAGGGGNSNSPPAPITVEATPDLTFTPNSLTVKRGDKVTFAFGSVPHNVTFDNRDVRTPADIPGVNASASVERVFSSAGTYHYHCTLHPGMSGTVVVK
jgi:plastocyanin